MGCAWDGRLLRVFGGGNAVRDYVYIDDVISAMLAASRAKPALLNISSGQGRRERCCRRGGGWEWSRHHETRSRNVRAMLPSMCSTILARRRCWDGRRQCHFDEGIVRTWHALHERTDCGKAKRRERSAGRGPHLPALDTVR